MKSSRSITLLVLLACLILSTSAFALDTGGPGLPPPIFDPCVGSSVTLDMVIVAEYNIMDGPGYYSSMVASDLYLSGNRVAQLITSYKRVDFGTVPNVSTEDTIIDLVDKITVFGHSVNRNTRGIVGVQGVITGAVAFTGDPFSVNGTYITTAFGGPLHFCVYLQ